MSELYNDSKYIMQTSNPLVISVCASGGLMACLACFLDTFIKLKVDSGNWKVNYTMCRSERSEEPSPKANLLQDFSGFFGLHPQNDRYRHTVLDTVSQMFVVHLPLLWERVGVRVLLSHLNFFQVCLKGGVLCYP